MQDKTKQAYSEVLKHIKELHFSAGHNYSDLRLVVYLFEDESFSINYIDPADHQPVNYSWPTEKFAHKQLRTPSQIIIVRFTEEGEEAPMIEFQQALTVIHRKYLQAGGIEAKFACNITVKDDFFNIAVISNISQLREIKTQGSRSPNEKILPQKNGNYLVSYKKGKIVLEYID